METNQKERVIIAGVNVDNPRFDHQMAELKGLAIADHFEVITQVAQKLEHRMAGTYFGQGKLAEIKNILEVNEVQTIIINDELSPTQIRNLEKILKATVIDRTELILEIFENRAQTKAAKIQVAIAKLQYEMPRIHPSEKRLDQQGGGNGGLHNRGAGETKSEINRRTILKQISELKARLKKVETTHETQSQDRLKSGIPQVALVGYTNAGKSTTFNYLTQILSQDQSSREANFTANMLFATLDTTVRSIHLANKQEFLLSDTVGFIEGLPHQLIESFETTLQEAKNADLLVNVVDYSDPDCEEMILTTKKVLQEIGAAEVPILNFYNKADLLVESTYPLVKGDDLFGSALDAHSMEQLCELICSRIFAHFQTVKLLIPFDQGEVASKIMANCLVISYSYQEKGTEIIANLSPTSRGRFAQYLVN